MSFDEKLRSLANNTGNMVFDNAISKLFESDRLCDYSSPSDMEKYDRYITTSYIWLRQNQPNITRFSDVKDKPYIPISVGLQAADYDKNFILHKDVVRELKEVSERCVVGCRGYYTAEILNKYGITNTMVIGCPSVYLNMFGNWQIPHKDNISCNKIASNFITFWRALKKHEQDFLLYAMEHNMSFVEQTAAKLENSHVKCDEETSRKLMSWLDNADIFFNYPEWAEYIRNYDFSIGYRFHGNVIALNNNIPALFIYSDSRVKEMCEFFKFPMISGTDFDASKPIEYWYEKADYSEFNKTQAERINNFKEFCRKNNLILKGDTNGSTEAQERREKLIINNASNVSAPQFIHSPVWKRIEFEGKNLFMANGTTIWQHLKLRLPIKLKKESEYFIKFRTKFKTNQGQVRFFVENETGDFQQICSVKNEQKDDYYDVSLCVLCNYDYDYLRITSSDFMGENYFTISDIDIQKITYATNYSDSTVNNIAFLIGTYAESTKGFGSIFEYFHDIGVKEISLFLKNDTLMKVLHAMAWEAGITINQDIALQRFSCKLGYANFNTVILDSMLEVKKATYNSDIPILVCCELDAFTKNKLSKLTNKIYDFTDIYRYAVVKNCIISPAYSYFKDNNMNVHIVNMNLTMVSDIVSPSDYEKQILTYQYERNSRLIYDFDPDYPDKASESRGPFWTGTGKKLSYINVTREHCVAFGGIRRTYYQPIEAGNNIWFVGTSVSSGVGNVIDEHTIESFLQNIVNDKLPSRYIVNNVIMPCGWSYVNFSTIIKELPIKSGDIVLFSSEYSNVFNSPEFATSQICKMATLLDTRPYFQRPHDMGEIFADKTHMNPRGYKKYAEAIFTELSARSILTNEEMIGKNECSYACEKVRDIDEEIPEGLLKYVDSLLPYRKTGKNGCIVMNCNPFTLGHRYLIEYASQQVDNLYIFVVEEDKSAFKFSDRFTLVKEGTKDLENVTVISSGKFIISALTFKAYFEKGEKQDVVVDTSNDLNIFGRYIAPALDITVRFAGEEPLDKITKQYNSNMKLLLPKYNVQFVEIPRKESGEEVISASRVRKLLDDKNFDAIAKLVPPTTLEFLLCNYRG